MRWHWQTRWPSSDIRIWESIPCFPIVRRGQGRGISGEIPHVLGPFPIVIGELAEQLPVVGRCVSDNLELFIVGCQEPQECRLGFDDWHGVLTAPELWQYDLLHEITAVLFSPRVDHFDVEFPANLGDQRQGDQLRLRGKLSEITIEKGLICWNLCND